MVSRRFLGSGRLRNLVSQSRSAVACDGEYPSMLVEDAAGGLAALPDCSNAKMSAAREKRRVTGSASWKSASEDAAKILQGGRLYRTPRSEPSAPLVAGAALPSRSDGKFTHCVFIDWSARRRESLLQQALYLGPELDVVRL